MAFPTSPSNNQVHKEGNRSFVYDSTLGTWDQVRETNRTARSSHPLIEEAGEVTFPSGHMVQSKVLSRNVAWQTLHISTQSDAFVDTGIAGSFVTAKSSNDSWLMFEFQSGMTHLSGTTGSGYWGTTTMTLKSSETTTYATGDDIISNDSPTGVYRNRLAPNVSGNYHPQYYRFIFHSGEPVGYRYPTSLTSYTAGQTLYARIYIAEPAGGTFYLVHNSSNYNFTVKEIMR